MSLKIGNLDIQAIKVGSADCKVYIGNELLYPSGFTGKFKATYASGPDYTLDCDGNTTLTTGNTKPSGYSYANMIEAVIGNCVTSIGAKAFDTCRSLNRVNSDVNGVYNIPNGVTSIGKNAFDGNFSCSRIMFPNTLTTIGDCAFIRCYGLTSITIPNSVTSIYGNPFSTCSGLTNITVDSNNTKYDSRNNCNAIIETSTNKLISGCKNTIIPNSVTSIGNSAFTGCYGLTAIDVPNSITSIGNSAFQDCLRLTSIDIPSSVTSINASVFNGCSGLTSIDIPSGVTSIGNQAFRDCISLTAITVNAVTPPTLGSKAFDNTNNCPIYVPAASVETYKAASGWSTYASRIQAIPTPSLTWVQFNSGDTINGLDIYGIRGVAYDIYSTFNLAGSPIQFEFTRNRIDVNILNCYSTSVTPPETNVEYVFSDIGCSDYYTCDWLQTASSTFELLIMQ